MAIRVISKEVDSPDHFCVERRPHWTPVGWHTPRFASVDEALAYVARVDHGRRLVACIDGERTVRYGGVNAYAIVDDRDIGVR